MRKLSFVLAVAAALLASCSDSEPCERAHGASSGNNPNGPAQPSTPDVPDAQCAATEAWCATPYSWPQEPGAYPGVDVQCYCMCDPNKSGGATGFEHPDCVGSPQPSECGTILEFAIVDGGVEYTTRFPMGYPTVCRYTQFQQAQ